MNCKKLHLGYHTLLTLSLCFLFSVSSCIDDKYDLNKDISTEMGVLGDITLPLGVTEPILLGDMIDTSEVDLLSLIDGRYAITIEDTIDVSIDAVGGDGGIVIDGIEEIEKIEENISENTELPTFNIDISSSVSIEQSLDTVALGEGGAIEDEINVLPTYDTGLATLLTSGYSGVDILESDEQLFIELVLDRDEIDIDVNLDAACPTEVVSISNIVFGDGTTGSKIAVSVDISALASCFDGFQWMTPKMKLEFPEDYVLENGTNSVEIESTLCSGSVYTFDIYIEKYTKEMCPDPEDDNKLPNITGVITCEVLSDVEIVGGTTNGTTLDNSKYFNLLVGGDPMTVYDMDLKVEGIEVIVEKEEVGDPVDIEEVSTDIAYVEKVLFVDGENALTITIDPIDLPDGLEPQNEGTIDVLFPIAIFDLEAATGTTLGDYDSEYIALQIPQNEMMGDNLVTVNKEVLIMALTLGADYPNIDGTISFEPGILVAEKTVTLAGTMKLNDYNDYAKESSDGQTINVVAASDDLEIDEAAIVTNGITVEMDDKTTAIEINQEIPAELVELYTMTFGNEVSAAITVEIEGLPIGDEVGDLLFDNYVITFPKFLKFKDGQVNEENQLVLDQVVIGDKDDQVRVFNSEVLVIEMLDFDGYTDLIKLAEGDGDNTLLLNDSVYLSGNIKLASGEASSTLETVTGQVRFKMSDIEVARITGVVDPEMPEVNESIDLSDLTEDLTLEDVSAVLTNPTISMNVTNPLSIPVEIATLKLVPYKNGVAKDAIQTLEVIDIAAGDDTNDTSATTSITLSAFASTTAGHYQIEGLQNLLEELPDSIVIDVEAAVGGDTHSIDVSKDYDLTFDYAVNIPLEFESLNIAYVDTIADLNESLGDIVDMVSTIELILEVTNALPFTVEIAEVTPLDIDGNLLSLSDFFPEDDTIEGGSVDAPSVSNITLRIADNDAKELALLDALAIKIVASVTSTDGGTALTEEQYLQLGLKVRLPEGLTIDIDDLEGDDEEDND